MRTRTLLLLAVVCGFVILVAGVVQLLRITGADEAGDAPIYGVGAEVEVGDLTVVVDGYVEDDATATVDVRLGGVDDDDGADEFRLVVPGSSLRADGERPSACAATTVATQSCQLMFDVGGAPGGSRLLLYRRGDEVARWELVDTDAP